MCHKTIQVRMTTLLMFLLYTKVYALCDSLQHAPRLQNESRQHHSTQVRTWSQLRDDVRENCTSTSAIYCLSPMYCSHHFPDPALRLSSHPPDHPISPRRQRIYCLIPK